MPSGNEYLIATGQVLSQLKQLTDGIMSMHQDVNVLKCIKLTSTQQPWHSWYHGGWQHTMQVAPLRTVHVQLCYITFTKMLVSIIINDYYEITVIITNYLFILYNKQYVLYCMLSTLISRLPGSYSKLLFKSYVVCWLIVYRIFHCELYNCLTQYFSCWVFGQYRTLVVWNS